MAVGANTTAILVDNFTPHKRKTILEKIIRTTIDGSRKGPPDRMTCKQKERPETGTRKKKKMEKH